MSIPFLDIFNNTSERTRCISMSILMFLTIIGYNVMRAMKEAVLVTLPGSGASYIPFVKVFVVLPCSFILGILYLYIRKNYGTIRSYQTICSIFLGYFFLFNFFLVPYHSYLHPSTEWIHAMQNAYPNIRFVFGIVGNWSGSLYYACGELWGTFTLLILFWQIANEIFTSEEASRIYPFLTAVSSIALVLASFVIKALSNCQNPLETSTFFILLLGASMAYCATTVRHQFAQAPTNNHIAPKKVKQSLYKSFYTAMQKPHILYLVLCVLIFSTLTNIIEITVKERITQLFPNQGGYLEFFSIFTFYKGLFCAIVNTLNIHYLRRIGWFTIAMITPIVCIVSVNSFLFYTSGLVPDLLISQIPNFHLYAVWGGTAGIILIYTAKYTFFDITKEMALIPLPDDIRANGKAAVDGLGGRLGKSSYGAIHTILCALTGFDHMQELSPYIFTLTLVLSVIWLIVMHKLNACYSEAVMSNSEDKIDVATPETDVDASPVTA